jgi:hypothetical protein
MKCQACEKAATLHVTDITAGAPVEYHVCEAHFRDLETLPAPPKPPPTGLRAFWHDPEVFAAMRDPGARMEMAAYLLPALCLALLDTRPEVRILAAYHLLRLGGDAGSALGALRQALQDADARVRRAARTALESIEAGESTFHF